MKKSLKNKIDKFVRLTTFPFAMYYTDSPINYNDDYYGCKYFLVYHGTHTIYKGFETQWQLEEFLDDELSKED